LITRQVELKLMKLKKGDKIIVLSGKDKGKNGKIEKLFLKAGKILVPGINIYKRNLKRQSEKQQGGIIDISRPIDVSKIALLCPKCSLATRIGIKILDSKKVRICKKCQKQI